MVNAIVKVYGNCLKYQVYRYDCIEDDYHILRLKHEHTKLSKDKLRHVKNKNQVRLDSLKRAKDKIFDIALLNNFDYFATFTFNDSIVNSYDYFLSVRKLRKWLENMVSRYEFKYLLVPELHKSGRIHFHALISGQIKLSDSGHRDRSGRVIYNLLNWRYGFSTVIAVDGNYTALCRYITKYITKDLKKISGNFYYAGGVGLERSPMKLLTSIDYDSVEAKEYHVPFSFNDVKYKMVSL